MLYRCYAKINLTLEVTGKRPDGYHELVSIMQTISVADELSLSRASDLTLDCDQPRAFANFCCEPKWRTARSTWNGSRTS